MSPGLRAWRAAWRAAVGGGWRAQPGRTLLSVLGVAFGVALAFAVTLINRTAVDEFAGAVRALSGQADYAVRGPAEGFDENLYPRLVRAPGVAAASPVVEVEALPEGHEQALTVVGLDVFRAARMGQTGLSGGADLSLDVLDPNAVRLSAAAARWLGVEAGGEIRLRAARGVIRLRVAGVLPAGTVSRRLAFMDIAGAQAHFGRLGRLSRVDLRLAAGTPEDFATRLQASLPPGVFIEPARVGVARAAQASRAYRVNLNVLSLVGLFTGAFLVFSLFTLSVLRRRERFALLRVLGLTRRGLMGLLTAEGAALGALGAALGLLLGYALAAIGMRALGGDLGGAYFTGVDAWPRPTPGLVAAFFAMGVGAAAAGAWAPAREVARGAPARALKAGDVERALRPLQSPWPGLYLLLAGAGLQTLPPVGGLPVFAYLGVACLLFGGVALMPQATALWGRWLPARGVTLGLAALRLRNAPGEAAIGLSAVLVAFSLMTAMAVMVASFRVSVDEWLHQLLRADLYARTAGGALSPAEQRALAGLPGVAGVEFLRFQEIALAADARPVTVIARPVGRDPAAVLPVIRAASTPPGLPKLWASEAARDLNGLRPGQVVRLPLAGRLHTFAVAGLWRDYARQGGAVVIDLEVYRRLTGDRAADDAALWLAPGASASAVRAAAEERVPGRLSLRSSGEIRALSLEIFDRSFAVTYALEAVAVAMGLAAVSASFGAQALARRAEFAVLRHLGFLRRQVTAVVAWEAALLSALGVAAGLLIGAAVSAVLIFVINPQSFHWGMGVHPPAGLLAGLALLLVVAATLTAVFSARPALRVDPARAVRED